MTAARRSHGLPFRDAVPDWAHVASALRTSGGDERPPLATIAITTFNRPELLVEAVKSALAQDCDFPFEIAVFDNQPAAQGWERLVERVPALRAANFRYWHHAENIGMFGNFNRCLELARGEWLTILADDDLLDPGFLRLMFAEIRARPAIEGLVCHKRTMDERDAAERPPSPLRRLALDALFLAKFGLHRSRRIGAAKLFWWPGGVVGTPTGFLFRRTAARAVGGFDPDEDMAADYWFYARFAAGHHLRQHRANAAVTRIGHNESANPATLRVFLQQTFRLQQALTREQLPRWWRHFSPLILARQRAFHRDFWKVDMPREDVEALLGTRLTKDRPVLYKACRLLFGGY